MNMLTERNAQRSPARESRDSATESASVPSRFSRSGLPGLFLVACALLFVPLARAQWQTVTYTLKGGWNAIYVHGDASHATIDSLVATREEVKSVWRWNPNPTQTQFNSSPLIPTAGKPEWSTWTKPDPHPAPPPVNTLTHLSGPAAYLVECSGTAAQSYDLTVTLKAAPPRGTWVRNGANLLGFPAQLGSTDVLFSKYFATFPVAIATNIKIYKYDGGPLGPSNPIQVFSPTTEKLDPRHAYWFEAAVVSDFYAPLEIAPSNLDGLIFGRTGSLITVRVRNRTAAPVILRAKPVDSAAAPTGSNAIPPRVPLTYRTFNSTANAYEFRAVTADKPVDVTVGPQSSEELSFGVDRTQMVAPLDTLYASLLRFIDVPVGAPNDADGILMDVYLPVSARVASLSGLWVGDVTVTNVGNRVPSQNFSVDVTRTTGSVVTLSGGGGSGAAAAVAVHGVVSGLTLTNAGSGYTSAPTVTLSGGGGSGATATASGTAGVLGVVVTNPGSGYTHAPTVTLSGGGGGAGAVATARLEPRSVASVSYVYEDSFPFQGAPTVYFIGGGGSGATAIARTFDDGGYTYVYQIDVTAGGSGYTNPPLLVYSGTHWSGATITGGYIGDTFFAFQRSVLAPAAVAGIDLTSGGSGYTSAPTVSLSGGSGSGAAATAVLSPLALSVALTNGGSGYTSAPTVSFSGGGGSGAAAVASLVSGNIAGVGVLAGGSGYTSAPTVSIAGGSNGAVTAKINGVTAVTISNGGTGYIAAPTVSFSDGGGSGAAAVATVVDQRVVGVTITDSGAGYTSAPSVTLDGGGGTGATATAAIASGSVTGFTVTSRGSDYTPKVVTIETGVPGVAAGTSTSTLMPVKLPAGTGGTLTYQWKKNGQPIAGATSATLVLGADEAIASGAFGTGTARPFTLRTIVHVGDTGTVRLLPHAFLGKLNAAPNNLGICTSEALLLPSALATARRFSTIHLPPEAESFGTSGAFALGQTLSCTVPLAYDAPTNPFVHTYHPDHDNRNPRFDATLPAGIESPAISRALSFTFTPTPPAGVSAQGWGSAVIGGTYSETVTGIHKNPTTVNGTFQLRRVSELGSLTTN